MRNAARSSPRASSRRSVGLAGAERSGSRQPRGTSGFDIGGQLRHRWLFEAWTRGEIASLAGIAPNTAVHVTLAAAFASYARAADEPAQARRA